MLRTLTTAVFLFACSVAFGQGYDPPNAAPGFIKTANDAELQTKLELTDKEVAAAKDAADLLKRVHDGKAQAMAEKIISEAFSKEHYMAVRKTFWQRLGARALFETQVREKLELSSDQKEKLAEAKAINDKEHAEMVDFMRRARFRSAEAMAAYKKKYSDAADERLFAVLTKEQMATFKAMISA